jgi:hypothetical protein
VRDALSAAMKKTMKMSQPEQYVMASGTAMGSREEDFEDLLASLRIDTPILLFNSARVNLNFL